MAGILFARSSKPSDALILQVHTDQYVVAAADAGYDYTDINSNLIWSTLSPYMSGSWQLFFYSGHGDANHMYGDSLDAIISDYRTDRLPYFSGKAVYSMACSTAASLLPLLVNYGAIAVAGFNQVLRVWGSNYALDDPYAISTLAGPKKFLESLIDGSTFAEAQQDADDEWDDQYEYWTSGAGSGDSGAIECAVRILEQKLSFRVMGPQINTFTLTSTTPTTGTLYVNTNNANAEFTITGTGGTYTGSGTIWSRDNVPAGTYTITYANVDGYTKPISQTVTLSAGSSATFTGTYVANVTTGSIYVTTNLNGASFTITGPTSYAGSGTSWSRTNAPAGTYTITFSDVSGYTTPSPQTLALSAGGTISFTGTYVTSATTGTIYVTTNLTAASFTVSGPGGTFTGYGRSWTKTNVATGSYTIIFAGVTGYTTPSSQTYTLSANSSISFSGTYVASPTTGTLSISTNSSNATFTISGPVTYTGSGTSWYNNAVPIGSYTISYGDIAGYTTPDSQTVYVGLGQTVNVTGQYIASATTGTIYVTTNISSASFSITGPASYSGSGTSWSQSSAPAGSYTITFNAVAGYSTPTSQSFTLTAGSSINFYGTYVTSPAVTKIYVYTNNALGSWTLSGAGSYSGSGESWSTTSAPTGTYNITFNAIPGYTTPTAASQVLGAGGTLVFIGNYVSTNGALSVTCNIAQATFSITGPSNYSGSGTSYSESSITPGEYTITYGDVAGYTTPGDQTLTVEGGQTIYFTGNYVKVAGTIQVASNISNAAWDITGPASYSGSGTSWTQANAPAGSYTIVFRNVSGYTRPVSQTLTLYADTTIVFTGYYTGGNGTIQVVTNLPSAAFSISGPASYSSSGLAYSVANAPAGAYTITYTAVDKYSTPVSQTLTLTPGATITFTGIYRLGFGTIYVGTNHASATFNIYGPENFSGSGELWDEFDATVGSYTIIYDPIDGYDTPSPETQILAPGGNISFTGTYTATADPNAPVVTEAKGVPPVQGEVRVKHGLKTVTSVASQLFASAVSSPNTRFTATTVKDYSSWDLSAVSEGEVVVTSDGFAGLITDVDDSTDTLTVQEWARYSQTGSGVASGIPSDYQKVGIFKMITAKTITIKAHDLNSAVVYFGFSSDVDSSNGFPISNSIGAPHRQFTIKSNSPINLTKIFVVAASAQKIDWDVGIR